MDYEKMYKDALERAKRLTSDMTTLQKIREFIFPELCENNDERIRKELINQIEKSGHHPADKARWISWLEKQKEQHPSTKFRSGDWIVYDGPLGHAILQVKDVVGGRYYFVDNVSTLLVEDSDEFLRPLTPKDVEKPAEWKPQPESLEALMYAIEGKWDAISPTSYLSRRLEDLYEGLVNTYNVDESLLAELPKAASRAYTAEDIEELRELKRKIEASMEQKPAEKQDYSGLDDLERAILRGFLAAGMENVPVTIIKETAKECLAQMKPAEWSDTDNIGWDEAFACVTRAEKSAKNEEELQNAVTAEKWLKEIKFKYYVHPVTKEWSEEDELMRTVILNTLDRVGDYGTIGMQKDWLKSLRPQYHGDVTMTEAYKMGLEAGKASSWKPSEEQMNRLSSIIAALRKDYCDVMADFLAYIYHNLEKLM